MPRDKFGNFDTPSTYLERMTPGSQYLVPSWNTKCSSQWMINDPLRERGRGNLNYFFITLVLIHIVGTGELRTSNFVNKL